MSGDQERHRTGAEARQHVTNSPVTVPSHGEAIARYLGAQHYRETTARQQEQAPGEPTTVAEVHEMPPIVVGIDGSRFGEEALRWALAEAQRRDCPVRAVMIAHTAPIAAAGRPSTMGMAATLSAEPGPEHLSRLQDTVRAVIDEHDVPRLSAEVLLGSAPETLCDLSRHAQLLVVGSHGHGALFEAVLGSVARYCVHRASCPVVVIPARLAPAAQSTQDDAEPEIHGFGPLL